MKAHFTRRLVAGLVLIIPVGALAFMLYSLYELLDWLGEPIFGLINTGSWVDAFAEHLLIFLSGMVVIYAMGFLADLEMIRKRTDQLDRFLMTLIPGYSMIKGIIGGVVNEEGLLEGLLPVLVRTPAGDRIGFETERTESDKVVVFLPNTPAASSGITVLLDADHVTRLDMPPHKVLDVFSFYGAGLGKKVEGDQAGSDSKASSV